MLRISMTIFLALAMTPPALADIHRVATPSEFNRAVATAKPGDTILIAPGEYGNSFLFRNVHGAADAPIVIAAADPAKPATVHGQDRRFALWGRQLPGTA